MRDIAKNIRQLRTQKNMTQDELAEKLFVTRQTVSNYETGKSRPDVEMLAHMAEVLETDVNTLIYGPAPTVKNSDQTRLAAAAALTALLSMLWFLLSPIAKECYYSTYFSGWYMACLCIIRPLLYLVLGWTLAQLVGMALKRKPLNQKWVPYAMHILLTLFLLWLVLCLWFFGGQILNEYLYINHIRGEWVPIDGVNVAPEAWCPLPPPIPEWLVWVGSHILFLFSVEHQLIFPLWGLLLWLFGFPKAKK